MYHFAVADIHRYMVDTSSASVENQVARLHLVSADCCTLLGLGS